MAAVNGALPSSTIIYDCFGFFLLWRFSGSVLNKLKFVYFDSVDCVLSVSHLYLMDMTLSCIIAANEGIMVHGVLELTVWMVI